MSARMCSSEDSADASGTGFAGCPWAGSNGAVLERALASTATGMDAAGFTFLLATGFFSAGVGMRRSDEYHQDSCHPSGAVTPYFVQKSRAERERPRLFLKTPGEF